MQLGHFLKKSRGKVCDSPGNGQLTNLLPVLLSRTLDGKAGDRPALAAPGGLSPLGSSTATATDTARARRRGVRLCARPLPPTVRGRPSRQPLQWGRRRGSRGAMGKGRDRSRSRLGKRNSRAWLERGHRGQGRGRATRGGRD